MIEYNGIDIWNFITKGPICITTNGDIKNNGECVMGRGIALEAKTKFPRLPFELGKLILEGDNRVYYFSEYNLFSFPVKHHWKENADLTLIELSCKELVSLNYNFKFKRIFLPRPGCGNGKLDYKNVKPVLEKYLDNTYFIINKT